MFRSTAGLFLVTFSLVGCEIEVSEEENEKTIATNTASQTDTDEDEAPGNGAVGGVTQPPDQGTGSATATSSDVSTDTDSQIDSDTSNDTGTETGTSGETDSSTGGNTDTSTSEETETETSTDSETGTTTSTSDDTDTATSTSDETDTGSSTGSDTVTSTSSETSSNTSTDTDTGGQSDLRTSIVSISASWSDKNYLPINTVDGSLDPESRWSSNSNDARGSWIQFELAESIEITEVSIAFFKGNERVSYFYVTVSEDLNDWTYVLNGESSGGTLTLEDFKVQPATGKYVRIYGLGNTGSQWNSYTEIRIKDVDYLNDIITDTETGSDTQTETATDSQTQTDTETATETVTDTQTDTDTVTETETSTDTNTDPVSFGDFSINSASGLLKPGNLITITGQGFGNLGPEYLFVSDFDQESVREEDSVSISNSQAGSVSTPAAHISLLEARSGKQSVMVSEGNAETYISGSNEFSAKDFNELFVSFHKYDDTVGARSSDIERLAATRKDVWLMRGGRGDTGAGGGPGAGNDIYLRHNGISGNSTRQFWYPSLQDPKNVWVNWQYWIRSNPSKPYSDAEAMASSFVSGQVGQHANAHLGGLFSDSTSNDTPPYWDRIKIGGYLRNLSVYHDDYYVAIGDHGKTAHAAARVEFFNNKKYEEATARSFCLIENWGNDSISCRPNVGDLDWNSDQIYCVVFNGNNKRTKEFDCQNSSAINRRLAYFSFSSTKDVDALKNTFYANYVGTSKNSFVLNDILDIQGEGLPLSISFESLDLSDGWNGAPRITHVSLPDLLMKNNLKLNGNGIVAKVSGLPAGKLITLRADAAYFRDGDYRTKVQLNQKSGVFNSEAKGLGEPVMLSDRANEKGELVFSISPEGSDGSYISWFSLEYEN